MHNVITPYKCLKGGQSELETCLFSQVTGKKWPQVAPRVFRLDNRKNYLNERIFKQWNSMPKEMLESPFLEVFIKHEDTALRDMV